MPSTTQAKLSRADRKRLKELRAERRNVARDFYHPAIWYGCEPASETELIAQRRAEIDAEIASLTGPPVPVLEGVIVRPVQPALW